MKFYWHECSWRSFIIPRSVSLSPSFSLVILSLWIWLNKMWTQSFLPKKSTHKLIIIIMKFLYQKELYRFSPPTHKNYRQSFHRYQHKPQQSFFLNDVHAESLKWLKVSAKTHAGLNWKKNILDNTQKKKDSDKV